LLAYQVGRKNSIRREKLSGGKNTKRKKNSKNFLKHWIRGGRVSCGEPEGRKNSEEGTLGWGATPLLRGEKTKKGG